MLRHSSRGLAPLAVAVALLAAAVLTLPALAQAPAGALADRIQAHLDAGEFAPALALARQAPTREQADAQLAQVALAQARAGARRSALRTLADVSDDRVRTDTLDRIGSQPIGGRGGGAQADFDSLIDLITSTVKPTTWEDVGGPGSIAPFPTGVYVDPQGVLQPLVTEERSGKLAELLRSSAPKAHRDDVRRKSPLRKVSIPRLEKHVQLLAAAGEEPTEAMRYLAGLTRVEYVLVYPETGDLVLAGPAGDWELGAENRVVGTESRDPVVRLDDLVVVLRHVMESPDAKFGCLIKPTQDALARTHAFLKASSQEPLPPGARGRKEWLDKLQASLGKQDIEVYGLDARTRAARVMVEADYRMKLVGMGLEDGVLGVQSYLDSIELKPGEAPPPMGVLRWWFTLDYDAVLASPQRDAFAIRGQAVQVLSENEKLTAEGKRVHTGKSEELNRQFARSFTEHFGELAEKYPIYAELRNVFDLALAVSLVREERLAERVGWHVSYFGDPGAFDVELGTAPTQVETVVNHRMVRDRAGRKNQIVAGASGGVRCDPAPLARRDAVEVDDYGKLRTLHTDGVPANLPPGAWWWD